MDFAPVIAALLSIVLFSGTTGGSGEPGIGVHEKDSF